MNFIPKISLLATFAVVSIFASTCCADIALWLDTAEARSDNVSAGNNGAAGWSLDGTAGVDWNYGSLDALDGKAIDGSTVEFIFNFSDSASSISIGTVGGWSPGGEQNQFKLEQWSNTGKFGITLEGFTDYSLTTDSIFDQVLHVAFVRNASGTMDMFLNGAFAETHIDKTNWRMDGGMGKIGSRSNGTTDVATGTVFGVASYDKALTASEISGLYSAFTAVPEPNSIMMFGAGLMGVFLRRRRNISDA